MKIFKDLEFKIRNKSWERNEEDITNKQALMFFPNGYGVSVLLGKRFYSNGINTYELAVLRGNEDLHKLDYTTHVTDDVLGYITEDEVTQAMIEVQRLDPPNKRGNAKDNVQ